MLAQIILVTRLLGLVTGEQPVQVQISPAVRSFEVLIDGKQVAKWPGKVVVDFGPELAPQELTVVAYNAEGKELARDTQLVNLGRPAAEAVIAFDGARPVVKWEHLAARKPKRVSLLLDGKPVTPGEKLPPLGHSKLHVLKADVEFEDGLVASKELVFGRYFEEVPAELTAVLTQSTSDCFELRGRKINADAVENPEALVLFVQGSDTRIARNRLRLPPGSGAVLRQMIQQQFGIENAQAGHVWPVAQRVEKNATQIPTDLFHRSEITPGEVGTYMLLTRFGVSAKSQRFADAVAVAGVQASRGAKRRAVVLVLTGEPDDSRHKAASVRRYLERIGVPLVVWSLVEITPKMREEWGEITDVGTTDRLRKATEALRADLAKQRIAWLAIDPLDALHVRACAASD